jgi:dolichol kinase
MADAPPGEDRPAEGSPADGRPVEGTSAEGPNAGGPVTTAREVLTRDEVARRVVHASGTALPALYLLELATWWQVTVLFAVGAAVALALEVVRLWVGLEWIVYDHLTREYEQDNLAGYALYMFSSAPVAAAFGPAVAVPAILMLTLADPISGLLGSGELRSVKQTWVLLAMFGVCTLLASPFVPPLAAVLGGVAATVADGVKPVVAGYVIDDNLTIPPAAALAMTAGIKLAAVVG